MVVGFRDKRPNLRKLHRQLTGRAPKRDATTERMLAQSNKRARKARGKQADG